MDRPGIVATGGASLMHGFDLAFYVLAAITAVAAVQTPLTIGSSRFPADDWPAARAGNATA